MASTPSTPAYFGALLERRWAEGITKVRHLFAEIRHRGYTGSFSYRARFLAPWRSDEPSLEGDEQEEPAPVRVRTLDPMTGRVISPLTAAALCVRPRGQMTGARPTTSITSSGCPVRSRWRRKSTRRRTRCAPSALCRTSPSCAATPKRATRPNPGAASGAPSPASKPLRSGSTPVSSSPTSNTARRNGFTPPSIARAAGREPHQAAQDALASDRTSCRSAIANQVRLALHTAAYWLMLTVRDAIPKPRDLANAEFSTLRLRLIKIAARVIETASRVRLAFAAGCPEADLFRGLPGALAPLGP